MRARPFFITLALLVLGTALPARANMAQTHFEGDRTGPIAPQKSTTVRVDRETLDFALDPKLHKARVTATYQLTNAGAAAEALDVAFVFVRTERGGDQAAAVVEIDGAMAAVQKVTDGELLDQLARGFSKPDQRHHLGFLLFHLDLPAAKAQKVVVTYDQQASEDRTEATPIFGFEYLLSPAKHWASFGPLDVVVHTPPDVRLVSQTPFHRAGDVERASLPGLPEGELRFEVMSLRGLWFGMTDRSGYYAILIAAMAAATLALGALSGRWWSARSRAAQIALRLVAGGALSASGALAVAVALGSLFPPLALGYGGFFAIMFFVLLAGPVGGVTSIVAAKARRAP